MDATLGLDLGFSLVERAAPLRSGAETGMIFLPSSIQQLELSALECPIIEH
jgi:hypothetical protein